MRANPRTVVGNTVKEFHGTHSLVSSFLFFSVLLLFDPQYIPPIRCSKEIILFINKCFSKFFLALLHSGDSYSRGFLKYQTISKSTLSF